MADSPAPPFRFLGRSRLVLLAIAYGSTAAMALHALLVPPAAETLPAIELPIAVPLSGWHSIGTEVWDPTTDQARIYRYRAGGRELTASVRYLPYSDGSVSRALQLYAGVTPASLQIAKVWVDPLGTYGYFVVEGKSSIVGCVNPYGVTTLTEQQFAQNVSARGWQLQRFVTWLLGQQDLIDRSCLFSRLDLPVRTSDRREDRPDLEAAWLDWVRWWQANFPRTELRTQPQPHTHSSSSSSASSGTLPTQSVNSEGESSP
ncbi:cyanoexosortase A system-associated protein [Rubidibacter lacunae]|nr:cyanoexosortase A system-associated protein [Rubidibacter lacunae]